MLLDNLSNLLVNENPLDDFGLSFWRSDEPGG